MGGERWRPKLFGGGRRFGIRGGTALDVITRTDQASSNTSRARVECGWECRGSQGWAAKSCPADTRDAAHPVQTEEGRGALKGGVHSVLCLLGCAVQRQQCTSVPCKQHAAVGRLGQAQVAGSKPSPRC